MMLSKSLVQLTLCRLREFRREPSAMIFVLTVPILWMLILGFVFSEPGFTTGERYIDFLIPGLAALSLFTTSIFGTGMTIVVNRRENLLKRYLATPMKTREYLLSHILGRFFIMHLELLSIFSAGYLFFSFKVEHPFALWVIASLSSFCFAALGILCGARYSNASTYSGLANIVVLLMMLLSGIFFSKERFPALLQRFSDFLPLSASVDAFRYLCQEGASFAFLWPQVLVLGFFAAVFLILAERTFVWK